MPIGSAHNLILFWHIYSEKMLWWMWQLIVAYMYSPFAACGLCEKINLYKPKTMILEVSVTLALSLVSTNQNELSIIS